MWSSIRRLLLTTWLSLNVFAVRDPLNQQTAVRVTGQVVSSQSLLPLAGVAVVLVGPGDPIRSVTDEDGRFSLSASERGYYDLIASKPGYPPTAYEASGSGGLGVRIALLTGEVADLALRLAPGAIIAGRVQTGSGGPASQVTVLPIWENAPGVQGLDPRLAERLRQWTADSAAVTDRDGRFRIFGLPPGKYGARLTWIRPPQGMTGREPVSIEEVGGPAPLAAGEERAVLLTLPQYVPAPLGALAGVIEADGTAVVRTISVLARRDSNGKLSSSVGTSATTGVPFRIERVQAGKYRVEARGTYSTPSAALGGMLWGVTTVDVESSQTGKFELRLTSVAAIECRIESTASTLPATGLTVLFTPLSPWGPETAVRMPVEADGRCAASLAPGRYRVGAFERRLGADMPWAVQAVHRGRDEPTRDVLTVSEKVESEAVVVSVTKEQQELSGLILDASDRPATRFTLLIYPEEPALRGTELGRVRLVRPATDGRFFSGPIALGRYRVAALDMLDPGQTIDAPFLAAADALAVSATVSSEGPSTLTIRVLR